MSFRSEFRDILEADADIASLATGGAHWGLAPQVTATDYITMQVISAREGVTMQGPDGLEQKRVQVDCHSTDYLTAAEMAEAVKAVLHGYRDGAFQGIFFAGAREDNGGEFFRASLDFNTNWRA